ncbi:von Willebrand factor type A domain containing protein [Planoprotostelium fungivorum]|uniref:von Willebrand factor type A domain containing protein n=1 Tax=Planoprotostelium fungivorum TaxID=1890364 RepID=A0A2P6NQA0_9EUKA|nr:von Willebrand factor type A domain containing protein [Planoprotostelium fungivorum]
MRIDQVEQVPNSNDVQLKATSIPVKDGRRQVLLTVIPPNGEDRLPLDVVCVVDISGSMGTEVGARDENGNVEYHGLSVLDLVKHAVKTVAASLEERDRLSVVTFSDNAKVLTRLEPVTDRYRNMLNTKLNKLEPLDRTNIWDGLSQALDLLQTDRSEEHRMSSILLFTDGQPNICPPRGEVGMLSRWMEKNEGKLPATLSTFGFGYTIDSSLLLGLAQKGGGSYCFIPDSTILGTAFVNSLANQGVTVGRAADIFLQPKNGSILPPRMPKGLEYTAKGLGGIISACSLQLGQSKYYTFPVDNVTDGDFLEISLRYHNGKEMVQVTTNLSTTSQGDPAEIALHEYRQRAVELMLNLVNDPSPKTAQALYVEMTDATLQHPIKEGIIADLRGQVTEACQPEAHKKWGRHFLPSIARAHQLLQCNNFKDPGVQHYGGSAFHSLRDRMDDIFVKLPPPKPSEKRIAQAQEAKNYRQLQDMRGYMNQYGGCFIGSCLISMADGRRKRVDEVKRGDEVKTSAGSSKIRCVLRSKQLGRLIICRFEDGLMLTPYHPVRLDGSWKFPNDIVTPTIVACDVVYTFLLEDGVSVFIDGVECIALAHGIRGDPVASHDFFGTEEISNEMRSCGGWANGTVTVKVGGWKRGEDGRVNGFEEEEEEVTLGQMESSIACSC